MANKVLGVALLSLYKCKYHLKIWLTTLLKSVISFQYLPSCSSLWTIGLTHMYTCSYSSSRTKTFKSALFCWWIYLRICWITLYALFYVWKKPSNKPFEDAYYHSDQTNIPYPKKLISIVSMFCSELIWQTSTWIKPTWLFQIIFGILIRFFFIFMFQSDVVETFLFSLQFSKCILHILSFPQDCSRFSWQ